MSVGRGLIVMVAVALTAGVSYGQFTTPWSDDFESYKIGDELANVSDWWVWDDNAGVDGFIVEAPGEGHGDQSLEIGGRGRDTDQIGYSNDRFGEGCYQAKAYWWINSDLEGEVYFIVQSEYNHNGPYTWAVQGHANPAERNTILWDFGQGESPVKFDAWNEIVVRVNFDNEPPDDFHNIWINGEQVYDEHLSWFESMNGDNPPAFRSFDLYANNTCCSYYDDVSLMKDPNGCLGEEAKPECLYKLKRNSKARGGCEACPKKGDLLSNGKGCDPEEPLKRECDKKFKPKNKTIPCPDEGNGICKKIKLKKRDSCDIG